MLDGREDQAAGLRRLFRRAPPQVVALVCGWPSCRRQRRARRPPHRRAQRARAGAGRGRGRRHPVRCARGRRGRRPAAVARRPQHARRHPAAGARPGWACARRGRGARAAPARRCAPRLPDRGPAHPAPPRRFRAGACRAASRLPSLRPSCSPRRAAWWWPRRARAVPPTPTRPSRAWPPPGPARCMSPCAAPVAGRTLSPSSAASTRWCVAMWAFHSPGWAKSSATISPAACSSLCRRSARDAGGGLPAPGHLTGACRRHARLMRRRRDISRW